ncbi:hypothetical protein ACFQ49_17045 [Kroppenstedtia eburnea]|uniref:hypothetical protein n=1 Tax=Kroppenstedtia eburnea TaxID=714067 RepID=UPI0036298C00
MIAEWLQKIPVFAWLALAVVLIIFIVVIFMVAGKRSREVDELEQAFKEPYHPPQNEQDTDREQIATEKTESEAEEEKPTEVSEDEPPENPPTGLGSRSRRRRN